jgi:hypothetical protein
VAVVDPDCVDDGSATTQELRDRWRKAEARTELFERNSLMWREAREEADTARRAYEGRLRTLSKRERSENPGPGPRLRREPSATPARGSRDAPGGRPGHRSEP